MFKIKKALKVCLFILLLLLAIVGVGISVGVPINFSPKREHNSDFAIELVEEESEIQDVKESEVDLA